MTRRSPLFLLVLTWGIARAQAGPAGTRPDAAALSDSIYALRVDPADHPGHAYVMLLEDGLVRLEADGRSAYTLRQVVQVLTPEGVNDWGELSFWYTPDRQQARVNWIRVVEPDGTVRTDAVAHQQETSLPVERGAPVFSDRRAVQVTLAGLAPGALVDFSYTLETRRPWLPGDYLFRWAVNGWVPVRRSRFAVDAPSGLVVPVVERNLRAPAAETAADGRSIRTWTAADLPAVSSEPYAGFPNDVFQSVSVYGSISWNRVAAWYDTLLTYHDELPAELLVEHARELVGAATLEDSLRRTYRWVAQDFRYVSLSLGDGGYRPRPPAEVFRTRFGDCKDKTILFVELARRMGAEAHPVLVHSVDKVDSLHPSLREFDHMIAALRFGGRTEFLDVTAALAPFGELPEDLQGAVGLALQGTVARIVVLPVSAPEQNRYEEEIVGVVGADGRFVGRVTVSAAGTEQYGLRSALADLRELSAEARNDALRDYGLGAWASAVMDSATYTDGRDLTVPPSITVWFSAADVVAPAGRQYYFNLPLSSYSSATLLSQVEADTDRQFPIDVARVNSPSVYRSSLELQLPDGWKTERADTVSIRGPFGYYRAEYRQAGRTFRASREMGGLRGLLPRDSVTALRAWLRAVADDRTSMIVLNRGIGPELVNVPPSDGSADVLPKVLLTQQDLAGSKIAREGSPEGTGEMLLGLSSTRPFASWQRDLAAEQMVFTHGSSRFVAMQMTVMAFATAAAARRPIEFLDLFDLRALLGAYVQATDETQMSVGETRAVPLDGVGERSAGRIVELVTPFLTMDMALLFAARGRVAFSMFAVGPQTLVEEDLAGLLRIMDQRLREQQDFLTDVTGPAADSLAIADLSAVDSALAAATTLRLDSVALPPAAPAEMTTTQATFSRQDGWPTYSLTLLGRGLTFPVGGRDALSARMRVTLHDTEAQALKTVLDLETDLLPIAVRSLVEGGELSGLLDSVVTPSSDIERHVVSGLGSRAVALSARLRNMFRADVDAVVFAHGRLSARAMILRPAGAGDPSTANALAEMMERRAAALPLPMGPPPKPAMVDAVRSVLAAERAVVRFVDARSFDAAFEAVEAARLARAPVGFSASTWNNLCWWASLHGHARRAAAACEAAVAPDTTDLAYRDSRGLGRAMAGDLAGALQDFEYIVSRAAPGTFLDQRAAWLEALRAGENPFTPEVVEELKKR